MAVVLSLLSLNVHADDGEPDYLYLFIGAIPPQQYSLDEEQTIVFKPQTIEVRVAEDVWEVEYEEFEKITLDVAPVPTDVKPVTKQLAGIDIRYDATTQRLVVESGEALQTINIFSVQGTTKTASIGGDANHREVSLADLPAGIYVVRASDGTGTKTLKFVKR